jgi:hypothetical protein
MLTLVYICWILDSYSGGFEDLYFLGYDFACYLLHAGILHDLFLDPEDGGDMFL